MALGDPFQTTFEGARQGIGTFGEAIKGVAESFGKKRRNLDVLRQFGILEDVEEPELKTLDDFKKFAEKSGVGSLEINTGKLTPQQQVDTARKLVEAVGLKVPTKKVTRINLENAQKAGMSYSPTSDELILSPKKPEKTFLEQITEAEAAKSKGYEYKGGKVQSPSTSGFGTAQLKWATENASTLADAVEAGDYSAIASLSKSAIGPVAVELRKRGHSVDEAMLGYKAQQSAMSNARLQEQKVESAVAAQTLLDSSYDPATGNYNVAPAQHAELAIAAARMLSPTGVVAQETIEQLRQITAREGLSAAMIWAGMDPSQVGGSTQSVIKMFAKLIKREGLASQQMLENLKTGKTTDFKKFMEKSDAQKQGKSVSSAAGLSTTAQPKTQSEYNALPSGTIYVDTDGQTKRKK